MSPQPQDGPDSTRGLEVEAILWNVVTRLRARGWHISLWEIQRSQDVIAYLVARFRRAPTDDELRRHLRPVLCARDSELTTFDEVFTDSVPVVPRAEDELPHQRRAHLHRHLVAGVAAALAAAALTAWYFLPSGDTGGGGGGTGSGDQVPGTSAGTLWTWSGIIAAAAVLSIGMLWVGRRKRLRRRPGPHDPGHDLELRWATSHPLDTLECVRMSRTLRARTAEPGSAPDVRRTVDASIRAGLRLTPCFVQHKRAPEYLAVIEQRSAQDVLATHHARIVDQIGAQGVAIRRVGLQPRSQLVIDPVHGRRRLESLQPTSERERLLLFAHDMSLRDPLTGQPRPWLSRFDRWSETTQIAPDLDQDRALREADRVLTDVRCLDPAFVRPPSGAAAAVAHLLPVAFEVDDELWIEACAPSSDEVTRALDLLITSLGPDGWYWLSACALYPEIRYELTVALGRLLHGDNGEPLSTHVDVALLARLPWFRHAYMPDWLRATLISTMTHGQLVEARAALEEILVSGLLGGPDGGGSLHVAEPRPGTGRRTDDPAGSRRADDRPDRVYLDGAALRRQRLAAAAPEQLVAAVRRQRSRFAPTPRAGDAPSARVNRALAWGNALLVAVAMVSTVGLAVLAVAAAVAGDLAGFASDVESVSTWPWQVVIIGPVLAGAPAVVLLVFSWILRRRRGVVLGLSTVIFLDVVLVFVSWTADAVGGAVLLGARLVTLIIMVAALRPPSRAEPISWTTFERSNRRTFLGSLTAVAVVVVGLPLAVDASGSSTSEGLVQLLLLNAVFLGLFGSAASVLAAAYFGGVRAVPLTIGGTIVGFGLVSALDISSGQALLYGIPCFLLLACCYLQLRRVTDRPPPDFWETRWHDWRWPLAIAGVAATAVISWALSGSWEAMLWITAVPATAAVLNLATELLGDRLARAVQRHRLDARIPLHFD